MNASRPIHPQTLPVVAVSLALMAVATMCTPSPPRASDRSSEDQRGARVLKTREVARGQHGGPERPIEAVARNRSGLEGLGVAAPLAEVDFDQEMALILALGERPTGGYGVEVSSVTLAEDTLIVRYVERRPGAGCLTTQALTTPYIVVAIPRVEARFRFERQVVSEPCGSRG